jgi:hypothetical protein
VLRGLINQPLAPHRAATAQPANISRPRARQIRQTAFRALWGPTLQLVQLLARCALLGRIKPLRGPLPAQHAVLEVTALFQVWRYRQFAVLADTPTVEQLFVLFAALGDSLPLGLLVALCALLGSSSLRTECPRVTRVMLESKLIWSMFVLK